MLNTSTTPQTKNLATHSTQILSPFSTSFVFAIVPHYTEISSEGLAFAISPTPNLYSTLLSQFLGLFNLSSKDQATNHIVVVKLDTIENKEFDDINDNYVSINLNGLTSVVAAPASYAKSSSLFQNLSLMSGQTMQVWAEYDAKKMELNVTLAPLNTLKPVLPLLSYTINFSSILLSKMYVGFSSSTVAAAGLNYILGWSLYLNGKEAELLAFNLLAAGNETA
ncbi:L-type lectin-domain containing receptor kinase IV.2-like [Dendrobium catenatum]|uniref:L-type lectin-domain containing receptor kinase IV.2 n=1 Tax=Dendrobium catenatum TaxID=906689 RepID=A0A2I0WHW1_9ASPA|nr:L-type lectin-domain containing receptor kinase IV.2-like [Dendrobium catenatum]PKU75249.1 L-type lectin-domain containing receptor kinase IV.2 [Dendrobium catenatum]